MSLVAMLMILCVLIPPLVSGGSALERMQSKLVGGRQNLHPRESEQYRYGIFVQINYERMMYMFYMSDQIIRIIKLNNQIQLQNRVAMQSFLSKTYNH